MLVCLLLVWGVGPLWEPGLSVSLCGIEGEDKC